MLKKRLIGVVVVKDGKAVQSIGYHRYLPLGRPECLVENLDRWGADEILVLSIDRNAKGLGPDFLLLEKLGRLGLSTPLIYGGGISTVEHAVDVIKAGAERLCIDSMLHTYPQMIVDIAAVLGVQAVIASLPLEIKDSTLNWVDYRSKCFRPVMEKNLSIVTQGMVSEILVIDVKHEGLPNSFDMNLIKCFPFESVPLIAFGGISNSVQIRSLLLYPRVAAVGVGNFLSYREHAIQELKNELMDMPVRKATYATDQTQVSL